MKPTLLGSVYKAVQRHPGYYAEAPVNIRLYYPSGSKISSSLAGVLYCIASRHGLKDCVLWVNKEKVAEGYLEIFLWVLELYPNFLVTAVRAAIEHET